MKQPTNDFGPVSEAVTKKQPPPKENVSRLLSIQFHAKNGNAEELERILSENFVNPKATLDAALIEAIRQARSSTDHLMCVKLLFSKGANLELVNEGCFRTFFC